MDSLTYNYQSRRMPSQQKPTKSSRHLLRKFVFFFVIVGIIGFSFYTLHHGSTNLVPTVTKDTTKLATTTKTPSPCAENTLSQEILISIAKQHLWACNGTKSLYDSPVVTGMEAYPADLTPPGTYHIYAKQTDLYLNGSDNTGSWHDHVYYWMPFLSNRYGVYGFHDATWRDPTQFGNVNINAPYTAPVVGSHGCVELPLNTAKWLYGWASVGTTVQINS